MSADKKTGRRAADLTISGLVIEKNFARGTKSEHESLYLITSEKEYVLRRLNANPFQDDKLLEFKGKQVTVTGILNKNTLLAKEIKEDC